nr:uncharacterized protein LOC113735032 isoform X1 [Coffea arabica]
METHGPCSGAIEQFTEVLDVQGKQWLAWTLTPSGSFIISSSWDALRAKRVILGSRKLIWNRRIPCKIAIFMWKLMNRLPSCDICLGLFCSHASASVKCFQWYLPRIQHWWFHSAVCSAKGDVLIIMPSFICWELWKAKNLSIYEGLRAVLSECPNVHLQHFSGLSICAEIQQGCDLGAFGIGVTFAHEEN